MRFATRAVAAIFLLMAALGVAVAQSGPLTVIAKVNNRVITAYELDQRARFLMLLRAGANPEKEALDRLIEERIQLDLGKKFGLVPSEEQILAGMEEFAQRGQLKAEDFIKLLASEGVEVQTFRDFVTAGLIWREIVRARFAPIVNITEADVDNAIAATVPRPKGVRVAFSEIILPADTPQRRAEALALAARIKASPSVGAFSAAAREYSLSGSRERGGRVDAVDLGDMQPGLAAILLKLQPGEISDPVEIPNAVALFQMRSVSDSDALPPVDQMVKYLVYTIPNGASADAQAELAGLKEDSDICIDLYAHTKNLPDEQLQEATLPLGEVPGDIALALAKLDPGEMTGDLTPAGNLRVVMLCSRDRVLPEDLTRDQIKQNLFNARLAALGAAYLAELRGNANIVILNQ